MFIMKDGKVRPAQVKMSSSSTYTLSEIHDLANRYGDETGDDDDLSVRLALSGFIAWLEKREQQPKHPIAV